jgi:DNA-directed RNA polymerase subunit L
MSMEVQRCFRVDAATGEPNDFTFYVESVGCLSVPNIVLSALRSCEAMVTKYQDLDGQIPENVSVQSGDARFVCVDLLFQHEGHTLGNLLQQYLVDNHIDGTEEPRISYAGYKVPHPLKPEMVLRVGLALDTEDPEVEMDTARLVVAKVCRYLKSMFQTMAAEWARHVGMMAVVDAAAEGPAAAANTNNLWNEDANNNGANNNNNAWNEANNNANNAWNEEANNNE